LFKLIELMDKPFAGATLPEHMAASLKRFGMGFGLAALVGIPLGLSMGWFRWLDDVITPIFDGVRFIAPVAWVPFAALWFGTGIALVGTLAESGPWQLAQRGDNFCIFSCSLGIVRCTPTGHGAQPPEVRRHHSKTGFAVFDRIFRFGKLRLGWHAQGQSEQSTHQSYGLFHV
jgi:ABC-type proline/glycine betaine transport system permease subunit